MLNQILGLLAVLCAGFCLYLAFNSHKKGGLRYAILFIMLAGLALRFYSGADLFLHPWDERYHALVAKNLIRHPLTPTLYDKPILDYDYKDWTSNHIWLHKQPLALWLMALSMKLFGVNEIALRLPSIILSTLAIFFTYYIGAYLFNVKTGLLASLFHAINGGLILIAAGKRATDHIDAILCFFIELGIFLSVIYIKKGKKTVILPLIGIAAGLAILTKWLVGLLIIPIWLALTYRNATYKTITYRLSSLLIVCLATFLPWQCYINHSFPKEAGWENQYNLIHIFEAVEGHTGSIFYYIWSMPESFGYMAYLPVGWFLLILVRQKRDDKLISIGVWFLLPYIFFSLVATKMGSYVMVSSPAIFLIEAYFWWSLKDSKYNQRYKKACASLLILLLLLPVVQCVKKIRPYKKSDRNPEWARNLRSLKDKIGDKKAVIFTDYPIEAMFYSPYIAYPSPPDTQQSRQLNKKGYETFIIDTDGTTTIFRPDNP